MSYTNDNIGISKDWLLKNHPQVLEEWLAHIKPERDLEAKRIKEKFDEVQMWLNEIEDHPRWKSQDDFRKAIQMSLDLYYEDPDNEERRTTYWNAIRSLGSSHPSFPTRKGIRSEEE